jgi:hypothetical protein
MKSLDCSRKVREYIEIDIKRRLAQHSNFACSICGSIPIIFHHIEEWSRSFSNDEELLIPICDKCHRGIHGEGGTLFSKEELYEYKTNPQQPLLLKDKLPLERKKSYAFFVGSNFIAHDVKFSLFSFSEGNNLLTVDTSTGNLMLTILAEVKNGEPVYLIKSNELMIDTVDIWDMHYSRSSLKIWGSAGGEKTVVLDLVIKPDVIILREMKAIFDGKPFSIYRLRKPQQRQVDKISMAVKECEDLFRKREAQRDKMPSIKGVFNSIDFDALREETESELLRAKLVEYLTYEFYKEFKWEWPYYVSVLNQVLAQSSVFARTSNLRSDREEFKQANDMIAKMKEKYKAEFSGLDDVVVEYNGNIWSQNIQV